MTVKDRIATTLRAALSPEALEVIDESDQHAGHMGSRAGGETHFRVRVTAGTFAGKSRIDRHRTINGLLAGELAPGGVHALAIEARAPGRRGGEAAEVVARSTILLYLAAMRRDEAIARLKAAESELRRFGVANLYLFGSIARDEAGPQSDVDVFVEPGRPSFYNLINYMGSYERLQAVFPGREVGYSTRDGLVTPMRAEIEREAIRVF